MTLFTPLRPPTPPPPDAGAGPVGVGGFWDGHLAPDPAPAPVGAAPPEAPPPGPPPGPPPARRWPWRWLARGVATGVVLLVVLVGWLAVTAPVARSLHPPAPPALTLLAADGTPLARRGADVGAFVDVGTLPAHVPAAFLAIEDRRFYRHGALDLRGLGRAAWHDLAAGGVREGGSTITQQLAKNAYLDTDRTAGRKLRELAIACWLEAWLTKDQILSRYLSTVYFGDNMYGLDAAARHYFGVAPARLSVGQAALLAGLVKAPSRLAPTADPAGAAARMRVVLGAMVAAGALTPERAAAVPTPAVRDDGGDSLPTGTYFADWVLPAARAAAEPGGDGSTGDRVRTTLDPRLQHLAERAVAHAGLARAQAALVAMRPDGRVVAMVGGRGYAASPFNRATQARRQPGSTFKLFVYLAALRSGLTPDSIVRDEPVDIAGWRPRNADGRYLGPITLRDAFARSSNVAAARLTREVGVGAVRRAARDLGVSTPLANDATVALGTQAMSLLELTAAYAAVADGRYPVRARGLAAAPDAGGGWWPGGGAATAALPDGVRAGLLDLLHASISRGTGRQADLPVPAWGKTGTTQDSRDALFVGWAGDLVVGVWVGDDDDRPNPGLSGGGVPARLWRGFMTAALGLHPAPPRAPDGLVDPDALPALGDLAALDGVRALGDVPALDGVRAAVGGAVARGRAALAGERGGWRDRLRDLGRSPLRGLGLDLGVGPDGGLTLHRQHRRPSRPRPPDEGDD